MNGQRPLLFVYVLNCMYIIGLGWVSEVSMWKLKLMIDDENCVSSS